MSTKSKSVKAIEISGLKKTYENNVHALKGIDLTVEEGDFFALLGPNGAGKSTSIGIICSLVNKSEGKVSVFGYDLDTQKETVKSLIGVVPQEFNFNQFETVLQIVVNQAGYYGIPKSLALQRAEKYLSLLDLWEKRNERGRALSGGMKRRLMIARALMHEPKLLILDEPTAGVDIELRRSMWKFLTQINDSGITIILTTHYLEEAESLCRNIAIIDQGTIVENTTMKGLLAKLTKETFVLDLDKEYIPIEIEGFHTQWSDGHTVEVDVNKSQAINAVFEALSNAGIKVMSMRNKANRLEELFVTLIEQHKGQ